MKIIIAGGRDFTNRDYMIAVLQDLNTNGVIPDRPTLVCGMARGADMLAHSLWKRHNMPIIEMPADWNKHGRSAGHIRNAQMAEVGELCLAFWDGKSSGTKGMIKCMNDRNKLCYVFKYE